MDFKSKNNVEENNNNNEFDNDQEVVDMNDDELFELLDQIDYEKETKEIDKIESERAEEYKTFCKTCKSTDKIAEDNAQGILVCIGCGNVVSDVFDDNPEWKTYTAEDSKETVGRCGNPTNFFLPQSSLGTTISGSSKSKIKILHSWSAMPYKERSLHIVLKEIQNRCRIAGIMKCIEDDAKILYKNISESKHAFGKNQGKNIIIRGVNRKSLIAACVFFACKRNGKTRSPKEIAKIFELKYKDITKGCKTFLKLIKLKQMSYDIQTSNPAHFITRYCRELHITNEYINQTIKIAKNIQKLNIASMHTPFSVATGSILLIVDLNNLDIERKFIAKKFNVSEVTVIKTYKKIEQYKKILINDELTDKLVKLLEEDRKNLKIPEKLKMMYNKKLNDYGSDDFISDESDSDDDESDEFISDDDAEKNFNSSIIFKNFNFSIKNNNIDEYIDSVNIDLYEMLGFTEENYKKIIRDMQVKQ